MAASRITATRVTLGAISLRSSSHFPLVLYSNGVNPVALPPGRDKLSTKPAPTGSGTYANTIGTVRVACSSGPTVALPLAKIMSGAGRQFRCVFANTLRITSAPPDIRFARCAPRSNQMAAMLLKSRDPGLPFVVLTRAH